MTIDLFNCFVSESFLFAYRTNRLLARPNHFVVRPNHVQPHINRNPTVALPKRQPMTNRFMTIAASTVIVTALATTLPIATATEPNHDDNPTTTTPIVVDDDAPNPIDDRTIVDLDPTIDVSDDVSEHVADGYDVDDDITSDPIEDELIVTDDEPIIVDHEPFVAETIAFHTMETAYERCDLKFGDDVNDQYNCYWIVNELFLD